MPTTLEADVFTATVAPILRVSKERGATARSLSEAFVGAMAKLYGDVELKETSAMVGFLKLLGAEGGTVSARKAARLYGGPKDYSEEAVRKAARHGHLIAIRDGNANWHFPVWQFAPRGGILPGLREVLDILSRQIQTDDLAAVTFLLNPTMRLGGISPLEALRRGDERLVALVGQLARERSE
jgi:hypothetical protein